MLISFDIIMNNAYRKLFEITKNPVLIIDTNLNIVDANSAFLETFGFSEPEEVIGRKCYEISHHLPEPCLREVCPVRSGGGTRVHEHLRKDGKRVFVEVIAAPAGEYYVSVLRDVTSEVENEREKRLLEVVDRLLEEGRSREDLLRGIVEGLTQIMGYYIAAVHLLTEDGRCLRVGALSAPNELVNKTLRFGAMGSIKIPLKEGTYLYEIVKKKRHIVVEDVDELISQQPIEIRSIAKAINLTKLKCWVGVPLRSGDRLIGVIGVGSRYWLDERDALRLHAIALKIGDRIEAAELYEELKDTVDKLRQTNRLKDLFIDIMRHDLLNPVGIVRGYLELLQDMEDDQEKIKILGIIQSHIHRFIELIDNASKFSRLQETETIEKRRINLLDVVEMAYLDTRDLFEEKGMDITLPKEDITVMGNPLLKDVFSNLLSNAAKFSPPNSKVDVSFEKTPEGVLIRVADRGIGVPEEDREDIFNRFYRLEKKAVKGSGLGLAIAKRIVDLHGGKIWVEDNPGGGSIFYVLIPEK